MNKSNILVGIVAVSALGLAGGSLMFTYMMTKERAAVNTTLGEFNLTKVAGYALDESAGDIALPLKHELKGGNTALIWQMAKNRPNVRQEYDGTWDVLNGGLIYNPALAQLKALEVVIATDSIVGFGTEHPAPSAMTETLRGKTPGMPAWFKVEEFPEAVFSATTFTPREPSNVADVVFDNAPQDWTHLIEGKFSLNGAITDLAIPAKIEFIDREVVIELGFQLDRKAFGIDGKIVGGWEVEDTVYLSATVASVPKGDALLAAVRSQAQGISDLTAEVKELRTYRNRIAELESQVTSLNEELARWAASGGAPVPSQPVGDITNLPGRFTDYVPRYILETETQLDPVPFEMVLVPGDAEAGIQPFYMATHEVTWNMLGDWASHIDIDVNTAANLMAIDLRPSKLYEDCTQVKFGKDNRPAISMSRTTAEAYAKWLGEVTGRKYRLPTDAEWQHALKLGGGIPEDREALLAQAWLDDNSERFTIASDSGGAHNPFATTAPENESAASVVGKSAVVGARQPNALGIYDMLGNAAEWVVGTGAKRIVRGGHFQLPADQLTADWMDQEDDDLWNASYPQKPNSRYWYRDHYYQGIRLVCEPVNVPGGE